MQTHFFFFFGETWAFTADSNFCIFYCDWQKLELSDKTTDTLLTLLAHLTTTFLHPITIPSRASFAFVASTLEE